MSLKCFLKGGAAVMPTLMEAERKVNANNQYPKFDAGYGEYDDGYGINFVVEECHDTSRVLIGDTHVAFHSSLRLF